jgi:hypothetical protein
MVASVAPSLPQMLPKAATLAYRIGEVFEQNSSIIICGSRAERRSLRK